MVVNGNVTVINRIVDAETRTQTYKTTVIKGVYFEGAAGIRNYTNAGVLREDKALVIIYKSNEAAEEYQGPRDFEKAPTGWTLRPEDYFVLGEVTQEITSIKDLEVALDDVYRISEVNLFTAGPLLHHWEVFGK